MPEYKRETETKINIAGLRQKEATN